MKISAQIINFYPLMPL